MNLPRDNNRITVIGGVSSSDGVTPTTIYVDPTTHRLLVDASLGTSLTVGTTTISAGTTTRILYDNAGVLGEYTLTGTGTVVVMATSPTISGHPTIEGVTSTGATGTGKFVFDGSPTLVTPVLGVATATSINGLTLTSSTGVITITNAKTLTVSDSTTLANASIVFANGKTLGVSNSITLAGTDGTTMTFPSTSKTILANDFTNASGQLPLANGGTNANLTASNGGIFYSTGSAGAILAGTATAGQILRSGASTTPSWSTATYPATAGTSGNVLTSDGTNWISSAPSGGTTNTVKSVANFETLARYTKTTTGGGTGTFDDGGVNPATSVTSTSSCNITWKIDLSNNIFLGSPLFTIRMCAGNFSDTANTRSSFFGLGQVTVDGSGHTYTTAHAGFKILLAGGVYSLYATQANGTTETASSALTTVANGDGLDLIVKINGTSSIDYYWRKNGGTLSSATNLTTNMPTSSTDNRSQFSVSNNGNANFMTTIISSASYER